MDAMVVGTTHLVMLMWNQYTLKLTHAERIHQDLEEMMNETRIQTLESIGFYNG